MTRVPIAVGLGIAGLVAYVAAVVTLADHVTHAVWPVQALYFAMAGAGWVLPARWLMLWAAHMR